MTKFYLHCWWNSSYVAICPKFHPLKCPPTVLLPTQHSLTYQLDLKTLRFFSLLRDTEKLDEPSFFSHFFHWSVLCSRGVTSGIKCDTICLFKNCHPAACTSKIFREGPKEPWASLMATISLSDVSRSTQSIHSPHRQSL